MKLNFLFSFFIFAFCFFPYRLFCHISTSFLNIRLLFSCEYYHQKAWMFGKLTQHVKRMTVSFLYELTFETFSSPFLRSCTLHKSKIVLFFYFLHPKKFNISILQKSKVEYCWMLMDYGNRTAIFASVVQKCFCLQGREENYNFCFVMHLIM